MAKEVDKHEIKSPVLTIKATDDEDVWNKDWIISLTEEEKPIGKLSFAGEKVLGTIPIQMELDEEYRNQGYGTRAFIMVVEWLFRFPNVYEVTAVTDRENDKCVKALKKAGFVYRSIDGRMETYSITKQQTAWTGLYLFIGIAIGLVIGIVIDHVIIGTLAGVVIAVPIGLSMDAAVRKERERVTGKFPL